VRLVKLDGKVVEIGDKHMLNKSITLCDMNHHLDGVLIITPFQIAHCVIKVCVCGSSDSRSFVEAFDYYSLQDIDSSK